MDEAGRYQSGRPIAPDENPEWDGVIRHSSRGPSLSGYRRYGCRCPECYALGSANRAKRRRVSAERKTSGKISHGITGYRTYGCRCEICVLAGAQKRQGAKRRKEEGMAEHLGPVDWESLAHLRVGYGVKRPRRES